MRVDIIMKPEEKIKEYLESIVNEIDTDTKTSLQDDSIDVLSGGKVLDCMASLNFDMYRHWHESDKHFRQRINKYISRFHSNTQRPYWMSKSKYKWKLFKRWFIKVFN